MKKVLLFVGCISVSLTACKFNDGPPPSHLKEHPATAIGFPDDSLTANDFAFGKIDLLLPDGLMRSGTGVLPEMGASNFTEAFFTADSSLYVEVSLKSQMSKGEVSEKGMEGALVSLKNIVQNELNGHVLTNEYQQINNCEYLVLKADIDWFNYRTAGEFYATILGEELFAISFKFPIRDKEKAAQKITEIMHSIEFK